ncbi:hypothetical protein [Pedobacter sandarakinus]|uniref:hypothetical protein n=1 Tax=Pedobacter sandarakinus TaxID=353156 RepID=UPI0022466B17|nr:hypothetical protein [Pedobacter sandarakinus]MCX2576358.1 hypothetical protein [Pedobacter sandarakinus]
MRFFITCDSFWETRVDKVIDSIDNTGYKQYFSEQDYGSSLQGVTIVLMCQDPNLNLKKRIRFSKKEKKIYIDIMLDLNQFLKIDQKEREKIVVEKIIVEIPPIIAKYKFEDFNYIKFKADLQKWMSKIL